MPFNIFLNVEFQYLRFCECPTIRVAGNSIDGDTLGILLYADDMVLLVCSPGDLCQSLFDFLPPYGADNHMVVNVER